MGDGEAEIRMDVLRSPAATGDLIRPFGDPAAAGDLIRPFGAPSPEGKVYMVLIGDAEIWKRFITINR